MEAKTAKVFLQFLYMYRMLIKDCVFIAAKSVAKTRNLCTRNLTLASSTNERERASRREFAANDKCVKPVPSRQHSSLYRISHMNDGYLI